MIKINESYPLYIVENLAELKDFYTSVFGFTAVFFEPEFYLHLLHTESGSQIGFMLHNHPSQPAFLHPASNGKGAAITLDTSNAKEAFEQAKSAHLEIRLEYTEEAWGQNHFIILDPQGLMIDVVEHVTQD